MEAVIFLNHYSKCMIGIIRVLYFMHVFIYTHNIAYSGSVEQKRFTAFKMEVVWIVSHLCKYN